MDQSSEPQVLTSVSCEIVSSPPKEKFMITQDDFGAIKALKRQGFKKRTTARTLGVSVWTVRKYWDKEEWVPYAKRRAALSVLDPYREYLLKRMPEVNFLANVLYLDIKSKGYSGSYSRVREFVKPYRAEQKRILEATIRFETGPGKQSQIDWGTTHVTLGDESVRIDLFAQVLGFSRRIYVGASLRQDIRSFIRCHLSAFEYFGGITEEFLYDNPKTVCLKRDFEGKDITWNPKFLDFAKYYGFTPRLCKPYRARTKGKVESGIKYVKQNFFALYGRSFDSLEDLNRKLLLWCVEIADQRIHGTTHEKPILRFEKELLQPVSGKAPYKIEEDITRIVPSDVLVVFETNRYSVPWRLAGEEVILLADPQNLNIYHEGCLVAEHPRLPARYGQNIIPGHLEGIFGPQRATEASLKEPPLGLWLKQAVDVEKRNLELYEELITHE